MLLTVRVWSETSKQKKALMPQGDLFAIFDTSLSDYEREALEFLYAYMPLADIADYSGEISSE